MISLDPKVGDFDAADVLIDGTRIADVRPNITAGDAQVIDASNTIVMPGFVDTHRHMWQGALRNILPDGLLSDYTRDITGTARSVMRPEDARIGDLVSALGAINAGVTTVLDWSHIGNSPAHADACIDGLRESGIRARVCATSAAPPSCADCASSSSPRPTSCSRWPARPAPSPADWTAARDVGASISLHAGGTLDNVAGVLGPDVTYIHCTTFTEEAWKRVADSGGHVSIAAPIEMEMGHGIPPIQASLDHGIRPSLSVDVETQMPSRLLHADAHRLHAAADAGAGTPARRRRERAAAADRPRGRSSSRPSPAPEPTGSTRRSARSRRARRRTSSCCATDAINVLPVNNAYGAVVLGMDTSNVDTVIIRGTVRKQRGQLVGVDLRAHRSPGAGVARLHPRQDRVEADACRPRHPGALTVENPKPQIPNPKPQRGGTCIRVSLLPGGSRMSIGSRAYWVALVVLAAGSSVSTHHSVAGQFDVTRTITLSGVVTKVDWMNPHIYLHLDARDESGAVTAWALETLPTAMMRKAGLTKDHVTGKSGEVVTVTARPARDGRKNGWILRITYPDGHYYQLAN